MGQRKNKNIEAVYPLSPMQQGMLFHSIYDPASGLYFEQTSFKLKGELDRQAFKRAVTKVIERNLILRTSFVYKKLEKQLQVVHKTVEIPLTFLDWREHDPTRQKAMLQEFLNQDRKKGFSLNKAPLLRLNAIQLENNIWQIIWSNHHILLDGWSLPIILKEVFTFYEMYFQGRELELPRNRPYRDYILWLQKQDMAKAEAFWRKYLQGFSAPTPLVIKNLAMPDKAENTYPKIKIELSVEVSKRLQDMARSNQLTVNTVVQGLWSILLCRYSGEEEVVFGATVSGRPPELPGVETMPGLFINTLPVRALVEDERPVLELLKRLQNDAVAQREYEYTSLAEIQRWSELPAAAPLFESIVVFENYPVDKSMKEQKSSLKFMEMQAFERTNYPLTFVAASGERLVLEIAYQNKLFTEATIRRTLKHLQLLAEQIAADPQQPLGHLSLIPDDEFQLVTDEWNRTETDFPDNATIHQIFEQQIKQYGNQTALQFYDQILTYSELDKRINQLANYLVKKGLKREDLVAVYLDRSPEIIIAEFAVMKAGGAFVPIDRIYPPERIRLILQDSGARFIITQKELIENLKDFQDSSIVWEDKAEEIADQKTQPPDTSVLPENLAYIIYTSGSTGKPKGTLLQHRGAVNMASVISKTFKFSAGKRILQFASIGFDASIAEIFGALLHGASLHLIRYEDILSQDKLIDKLRREKISHFILPPSVLAILDDKDLPDLEVAGSAGEACSVETAQRWSRQREFVNGYGPTESTVAAAMFSIEKGQALPSNIPIGPPIENIQLYVLDQKLRVQPIGVPGELHIAGVGLARGYLNRPELTAEKFIPNPFNGESSRMYKTGDLVRWLPDGNLEFLGRIDFQVKIRGFRIELGEVENVLASHPQISDAVVTAHTPRDGETLLAAYFVYAEAAEPDTPELVRFLKERLPDYMVPSVFVAMENFPLTPSGKVDRRTLPAPDTGEMVQREYVAPRNQTEDLLTGIYQQILKVDKVGISDNFFELGGHSLMATQLMSRIRNAFEVEISLRDFFAEPTISQLALQIEQARLKDDTLIAPPIEPIAREGDIPLSFAQQRLWFLDQLAPGKAGYNIPTVFRLRGKLNTTILKHSIQKIVERHEVLRTTFSEKEGQPVQIIQTSMAVDLPEINLSHLSISEAEARARELAMQEAAAPFDLASGPLFRGRLIQLADQDYVLLFTLHHIVADGWSMGILVKELASLYPALLREEAPSLPDLPVQYADYAVWQRNYLQGEILRNQITFWKELIGQNPPVLELPADHPRPALQTFNGHTIEATLPAELSEQIKRFSQRQGATLFMTLLAAFQTLMHRYSGQDAILVGSPIANRTLSETEPLIGFFVNTLVLKADFSTVNDFRSLLKQVRETTLQAYAYQDLPFEQLVEALQPERDMSHSPLFQVAFILQNMEIDRLQLPDLSLEPFKTENRISKYDLTLNAAETENGIACYFEYNTDLFEPDTIERMKQHYFNILQQIVLDPKQSISRLDFLTKEEKENLFDIWNRTSTPFPAQHTVTELFERMVRDHPENPAGQFDQTRLSYEQLNVRANQLAHYLIESGLQKDEIVGISLPRSLDIPIAILGILKAGGAFLSIDPGYPPERIQYMLQDSHLKFLITNEEISRNIPVDGVALILVDRDDGQISVRSPENPPLSIDADNLAYVIYTSGSTGKPKGTMLCHQGLVNLARAQQRAFQISEQSRILQFASLSFDASVWETVMALLNGATLVLAEQEKLSSGQDLVEVLKSRRITTVTLPPSVLAVLPQSELPELRTIVTAGEKCTTDLVRRWGKERQFVNAYGPTETTVCASMYEAHPDDVTEPPIGKPIDNFELYVMDRNLQPTALNVPGELCIGGIGLARGYLNRPELTAEKFIPNPFSKIPGSRLYRSGDLVRWRRDGNMEFLGRIDLQVKVRGFRIELGEIETVLTGHEKIRDVAVLAREDSPGQLRLVAYYVTEEGRSLPVSSLKKYLKKQLPEYMIPALYVHLESMPLSPSGKVDRKALPLPEQSRDMLENEYVAPRNDTEKKLTAIVAELLDLKKVGIYDNFFELGGHSLLATQFVSHIRKTFKVEIPLQKLFESPTVSGIAEIILGPDVKRIDESAPGIEHIERGEKGLEDLLLEINDSSDSEGEE